MSAARFSVRVHAGARRDQIDVPGSGTVVVHVTTPALEGRANHAARRLLAKRLGLAPSRLSVVRGEHARDKLIEVDGIDQGQLDELLRSW